MDLWEQPVDGTERLSATDLHLWRVRLDGVGTDDRALERALSDEEHERAHRFLFDLHRQRFIRTHAFCRAILARYTHIPAAQLVIRSQPEGKPFLAETGQQPVRFNLSHSGDWMALGVTLGAEVGVDVEIHSAALDWRQIAGAYFDSLEVAAIEAQAGADRQMAYFYRIWTMKEAYLKARGQGIAAGLRQTIVKTGPELPVEFDSLPGDTDEIRRWQVLFFQPATGVSGTVVIGRGESPYRITRYDGTLSAQDPN